MATRDLRSYFTSVSKDKKASHGSCTSIPQLVKATGMLLLLMHRLLTLNWRVLVRKKNTRASHTIPIYLLVSKKKLENMHTPTEHKLPLNALNQSTLTTLFYVRLKTIGNVNSIKKKVCHPNHRHSGKLGDLILSEMNWCRK